MGIGAVLNRMLRPAGYRIDRLQAPPPPPPPAPSRRAVVRPSWNGPVPDAGPFDDSAYDQDGLRSIHNHEFLASPHFRKAYQRGMQAVGRDLHWHWRVHVGLWAAYSAACLDGDFVECGVNRGFLSSAIMTYLDWNKLERRFFLLDTFNGIDLRYVSAEELAEGIAEHAAQSLASNRYTRDVEEVRANFAEWDRVVIIHGPVPETLPQITTDRIAFMHIDMNCSPPEVAALEYLWDRLVPGAFILLDDYAYHGYRSQKLGIDRFAGTVKVGVLSLPTGQGLIIKPPAD